MWAHSLCRSCLPYPCRTCNSYLQRQFQNSPQRGAKNRKNAEDEAFFLARSALFDGDLVLLHLPRVPGLGSFRVFRGPSAVKSSAAPFIRAHPCHPWFPNRDTPGSMPVQPRSVVSRPGLTSRNCPSACAACCPVLEVSPPTQQVRAWNLTSRTHLYELLAAARIHQEQACFCGVV